MFKDNEILAETIMIAQHTCLILQIYKFYFCEKVYHILKYHSLEY